MISVASATVSVPSNSSRKPFLEKTPAAATPGSFSISDDVDMAPSRRNACFLNIEGARKTTIANFAGSGGGGRRLRRFAKLRQAKAITPARQAAPSGTGGQAANPQNGEHRDGERRPVQPGSP